MANEEKGKNLSAILYDEVSPPRYLTVNQGVIEKTLGLMPVISLCVVGISLLFAVYYRHKASTLSTTKVIIKEVPSNEQNDELIKLKTTITKLQNELEQKKTVETITTPSIAVVKNQEVKPAPVEQPVVATSYPQVERPQSAKNLIDQKQVLLQNFKVEVLPTQIKVLFDLSNHRQDKQKIKGHILSFLYHKHGIEISHGKMASNLEKPIPYNWGERFQTERFRPSTAIFTKPLVPTGMVFKVFVFAENGDLLAQEKWEQ